MNIKKMYSIQYWKLNLKRFYKVYEIDIQFNASFHGGKELPYTIKKSREMRYIKLYRMTQVQRNTIWFRFFYFLLVRKSRKTGIGLYVNLNIGKGLIIGHSGTIVLNESILFGDEIMLTHGVTIGRDVRGPKKGTPIIGNRVCIRTNSTVVGKIKIGDDVLIAPNTFVNFDVPSHSIVIGNPAEIHHRENATEGHLGTIRRDEL